MKASFTIQLTFLCLIILFANASCKRLDGETVVEGQIVDQYTGKPVSNGKVVVFSAGNGSNNYGYLTESPTDAKGNFSFSFEGSGDMVLRGFTDLGYYSDWEKGAVKLKSGRNNKDLKVKMVAPAWVKVKLVNAPPLETSPRISVWGFSPDEKAQIGIEFFYLKKDTTFIKKIMANWDQGIAWSIRAQDGTDTRYGTRVYAASLDTVEVRIEY